MALVSRFASVEKAVSVKREVKHSVTRRLKERVGIHDSSSSESSSDESDSGEASTPGDEKDRDATLRGDGTGKTKRWGRNRKSKRKSDVEKGDVEKGDVVAEERAKPETKGTAQSTWALVTSVGREQSLPDDAVLTKDGAKEVC